MVKKQKHKQHQIQREYFGFANLKQYAITVSDPQKWLDESQEILSKLCDHAHVVIPSCRCGRKHKISGREFKTLAEHIRARIPAGVQEVNHANY